MDVTAIIKTFLRDEELFYGIESLRRHYHDMPIIVADDGYCSQEKGERLRGMGCTYLELPWNRGLSVGRNTLLDAVQTPYLMLGDDDFSYTADSNLTHLRALMDISDIAAGTLYDCPKKQWDTWGGCFVNKGQRLYRHGFSGELQEHRGIHYQKADYVLNFFVAKVDKLRSIRWDDNICVGHEHLDFFMRAYKAGLWVVRTTDAQALHKELNRPHPEYKNVRWDVSKYEAVFRKKWGYTLTWDGVYTEPTQRSAMPKNRTLISVTTHAANKRMPLQQLWMGSAKDAGYDVEVFDGPRCGVPDDYINVPLKYQYMCRWGLEHGYERVLSMDDDSYINFKNFQPCTADYAGYVIPANPGGLPAFGIPDYPAGKFPHPYASGGAFWLSAKSMRVIVDTPRPVWVKGQPFTEDWAGDRWVGHALAAHGIQVQRHSGILYYPFAPAASYAVMTQVPDSDMLKLHQKIVTPVPALRVYGIPPAQASV